MMLSVSALSAPALSMAAAVASTPLAVAACATVAAIFSPSQHPFMRRVRADPNYFSFDPYKMVRTQYPSKSTSANTSAPISASSSFIVSSPATRKVAAPAVVDASSAAPSALSFRVVSIAFKQGIAQYRAPFRLVEGDVVVVEGDRGEHIGSVKAVHSCVDSERLVGEVKGKVIRRATASDLDTMAVKVAKEITTLADVSKVAKEVRLNASIADVEYQFDNNKLTVYVERSSSTTFVDFRKVQRTLFKMFHCRIWFVYMDEVTN